MSDEIILTTVSIGTAAPVSSRPKPEPAVSKLSKSEQALLRRQMAKRQQKQEAAQLVEYNERQAAKAKASKKPDREESLAYSLLTPAQKLKLVLHDYKLTEVPGESEHDCRVRIGGEIGRLEGLIGPNDVKPGFEYTNDQERQDCATRWLVLLNLPLIHGEDIVESESRITEAHCKKGHPDWNVRQSRFEEPLYNDLDCPCTFQIPRRGFRGPEPETTIYWNQRDLEKSAV